jgi:multimeric flavodoxin WrbA
MKVVAFNGSPHHKGNTSMLLDWVLEELETHGIATEKINIGGKPIAGCIACYKCLENKNQRCAVETDKLNDYVAKMIEADGIILGSPVYFADLTGPMKCLVERAGMVTRANGDLLKRKAGAAVVAVRRAGSVHTFDSLNHFFLIGQMIVPGSSYWNISIGRLPGEVEKDDEGRQTMTNLGKNMAWLLEKIQRV